MEVGMPSVRSKAPSSLRFAGAVQDAGARSQPVGQSDEAWMHHANLFWQLSPAGPITDFTYGRTHRLSEKAHGAED
jgi:hypothetical protein